MSTLAERAEHAEPARTEPGHPGHKEPVEVADGYRAGRTLPLRVELVRQLKRRRTMVMGGILFALPLVLLIAFQVGGTPGEEGGNRVNLMDTATASGANFAAVNLFAAAGFLLVIPVALFCGDTVASEASWSSLRYLLAAPVPRARLLWSKLVVGLTLSLAAIVLLPVVALAVGSVAYGWGPLELPTGGEIAQGAAAQALLITVGYIFVSQLVTAALAFWLSTRTDAPLGAVGGAVGLTIVGNVLDSVTALGDWRDFLPAHWQYAWLDVVRPQPEYTDMIQGVSVSVTYALVLFALAFRGFGRKDVVS
ncbi:ABC transporter permease [Streptomyces europaeiscabiei]|uniref:ABC transporter permease subunit n=1 Tax=Streptomyces europaeiscabiei TaxID=146819 RepID=A0ABU4NAB7_9ACTN|nr:ABC transporter permease [Streptomyces europaeiscabiei]MDX2523610.1 ABC transporter permease subunit [Streptomyces europaeiscabiei]MDX2761434.1 ABC transporter permease subunit [Streptomyces europaeiscabiei]MDX2771282.1 ABC transporter permease subunit [Streptomyces europaeiscabiei]MDX3541359.1 ABC transporter permease subunit [Streptomyces europaeiscabiei]MDX3551700.1 ABC transporter permease subunit [Streptomyces europaeiscabiei]